MRKILLVSVVSLIVSACGGSDSNVGPTSGSFPIDGKWVVSGAMSGVLTLTRSGPEAGATGATATLYTGTINSQSVTARQPFVSHAYDSRFTMNIAGASVEAVLQDEAHFTGTLAGAALSGVRE